MQTPRPPPACNCRVRRRRSEICPARQDLIQFPIDSPAGYGFRVSTYFPSDHISAARISPFILLDYHLPHSYPPAGGRRRGVGPHPHRGFETVTIAYEGSIAHRDSAGNGGVINPGDVQWMTEEEIYQAVEDYRSGRMGAISL